MSSHNGATASSLRAGLNHPVIDCDGHWREFPPVLIPALRKIGGEHAVAGFQAAAAGSNPVAAGLEAPPAPGGPLDGDGRPASHRRERREPVRSWWVSPWNTLDRATAVFPRLLYERLDELGLDFVVLFPTYGLGFANIADERDRRACCRAYNTYLAEEFAPFADRITPVAPIPMHSPHEAIAELEHAVGELGLKAIMLGSLIRRPRPDGAGMWLDTLGLDSAYDYDPVWGKCQELGVAPAFHSRGYHIGLRMSVSRFVYNHIGHFASAGEAVCKSLFLGGVTRRFPKLRFAFLEGGVGWACNLYSDLISHWKKRNPRALEQLAPSALDHAQFADLARRYGEPRWREQLREPEHLGLRLMVGIDVPEQRDDFAACAIERPEDFRALFAERFFFGCEPDDPTVPWAFNSKANPYRARLGALFSSDISHWDVPDMAGVLPEAYELVEEGLISAGDFKDFVFGNAARFLTAVNPAFFDGTKVETAVRDLLRAAPSAGSAT